MAALSKAEYLKRYLCKDEIKKEEKKKKVRKVKRPKESKIQIIDDDVDLSKLNPGEEEELGMLEEEKPQIAEVIDERPKHIRDLEAYRKDSRWRVLGQDEEDAQDSDGLNYGVIQSSDKGSNKTKKAQNVNQTTRSKGRRQRHDSMSDSSTHKTQNFSQTKISNARHDSDSDMSPPRGKSQPSSQRKPSHSSSHPDKRKRMDSDGSPPRKTMSHSESNQGAKRRVRHDSDSDQSPPRSRRVAADTDQSPPRRKKGGLGFDQSPLRRKTWGSDSDQSPQRRKKGGSDSDQSPPRRRKGGSESDQSPPRRKTGGSDSDQSPPRRKKAGVKSELSPPRQKPRRSRHDSDSDQSLPKKGERRRKSRWESSPDRDAPVKKVTKTLSGAKAGLSTALEMREEARKLREKEERAFSNIDEETLGRHAKTVVRDKQTGKRRNTKEDDEREKEEERRKEELAKKYGQWGKGLKQQADKDAALEDQIHEASKPLARYQDDKDLDAMLREEERMEDPMLAYIKKKKKKKEETDAAKLGLPKKKELPKYSGRTPPPLNRFNIWPGYRWDGVDRSNGFEKKIFAKAAEKKAVKEIAYKWSTEDM